ncbi:MAG: DUF2624 domain-containing protein [Candidatus Pacearchaeota archaeon]|nr:DUF2624 domain-containing protein [Candidatus Pacearchaeota archaeon]
MKLDRNLEEKIWDEILEKSKRPTHDKFQNEIDLTDLNILKCGRPSEEQIIEILNQISKLDQYTSLVLPEKILYEIDPRTVRKNVRPICLRRIRSKTEAIEKKITLEKLIKEKIEEMREKFISNPEKICEDYAGINYRGITDKKVKNYLMCDVIEGYLHAKDAGILIETKRYDTLEKLLKSKEIDSFDKETRKKIVSAIKSITSRELMTEKMKRIPGYVRKVILTKQSERVVLRVPSTTTKKKYYKNIKFRKLPQFFIDGNFPELNSEVYASWMDVYTEPSCNCEEKTFFITYLPRRVNQIWYCVHEIAAFLKMMMDDWKKDNDDLADPRIGLSPFFIPTLEAIEFYKKLRNQVFVKTENSYKHLPKIYLDIWLEKLIRTNRLKSFIESVSYVESANFKI